MLQRRGLMMAATEIRRPVLTLARWMPGCGARPLFVEDRVPNTLRVPFVRAMFPEAMLVHQVYDARVVGESARRVWNDRP